MKSKRFLPAISTWAASWATDTFQQPAPTSPSLSPKTQAAGKAFDPKGPSVQIGVDPNTVNITRDILPEKLKAIHHEAQVNGGIYRPVEVFRNGNIIDGNHRTQYARETDGLIDIYVK